MTKLYSDLKILHFSSKLRDMKKGLISAPIPELEIRGLDISKYALRHAKKEVNPFLKWGSACCLPYPDKYFDLVISLNTLHFLHIYDLEKALHELERVKRGGSYLVEESYRNEIEKNNLLFWQLTCECFFTPAE